ncbi:MAG: hypothetical protein J4N95_02165 [Chloroflexi bacterium]|nr:hypothetical protein [Chloroflexota bacterium]MCI0855988.1 hypothetical protein [Chloroflexota bacterium]
MILLFPSIATVLLVLVGAALIFIAMRRYPSRFDAVLQGLGFKLELHGVSDQTSEQEDSDQQE